MDDELASETHEIVVLFQYRLFNLVAVKQQPVFSLEGGFLEWDNGREVEVTDVNLFNSGFLEYEVLVEQEVEPR